MKIWAMTAASFMGQINKMSLDLSKETSFQSQIHEGDVLEFSGVGLHSGKYARIFVRPGQNNSPKSGISFTCDHWKEPIDALYDNVVDTTLCTVLGNESGGRIATTEHLLSALYAAGICNAVVHVESDGPVAEMPILDGSSRVFMDSFSMWKKTVNPLNPVFVKAMHGKTIKIRKEVIVGDKKRWVKISPGDDYHIELTLDFTQHGYNKQNHHYIFEESHYKEEIASARTFCFFEDIEYMRKNNLALGGSLDNAVVIKDGHILNPKGLRFEDECVRHKILDIIGDLALSGMRIEGHFVGYCSGHALNVDLLRTLFSDASAYDIL